ncbi:MAG: hypothetical protein WC378_07925, partial [Opitutaceae bacterium]
MSTSVSHRQWLLLGFSAATCAGVLAALHQMPAVRVATDSELTALTAEREQLRNSDDATLET